MDRTELEKEADIFANKQYGKIHPHLTLSPESCFMLMADFALPYATKLETVVSEILELVEKKRKECTWENFERDDTPWGGFELACEQLYDEIADRFPEALSAIQDEEQNDGR